MYRPNVKNVVRMGLFALATATVACESATAPSAPVSIKKAALKDTVPPLTGECRSGYILVQGRYVCSDET